MPTKAGRIQLKDLKQGKQMWMVQTRAAPVYDHTLRRNLPNVRMVKIIQRPVEDKPFSSSLIKTSTYRIVAQETIDSLTGYCCQRSFSFTELSTAHGKRLLVTTHISAPTYELFVNRRAAERFMRQRWKHPYKYLVQNDGANTGTIGSDFDGDENIKANMKINTMLNDDQRAAFRYCVQMCLKVADVDGDALSTRAGMVAFDLRTDTEDEIVKRAEQFWVDKASHIPDSYDNFILALDSTKQESLDAFGITLPVYRTILDLHKAAEPVVKGDSSDASENKL